MTSAWMVEKSKRLTVSERFQFVPIKKGNAENLWENLNIGKTTFFYVKMRWKIWFIDKSKKFSK